MGVRDPKLPQGSLINGQILVTSYMDREARMKYAVGINGDMNIAQALGLLVLSGISVFQMYLENNDFPADEEEDDDDLEDDEDEMEDDDDAGRYS